MIWLEPLVYQVGVGGQDAKRLAMDERVVEEESELFFSGGKDAWQKFLSGNFGHRPKGERCSLAGSDFVIVALEKK